MDEEDRFIRSRDLTKSRRMGMIVLLFCGAFSAVWAIVLQGLPRQGTVDFKIIYIAAKCLLQHRDPYVENEYLQVFQSEGERFPDGVDRQQFQHAVMAVVYLPTALFVIAPLAMLSWIVAQALWTILTIGMFTLACCLVWSVASDTSPLIGVFLCALLLGNVEIIFAFGNAAGIAVSLCAIAVWSFVTDRLGFIGVSCLALSLALKPHDSIAVWICVFILGGSYRRRAIQTLCVVVALSIPAILWVSYNSPHWTQEIRSNLREVGQRGGIADPGPAGVSNGTVGMIISLQSAASIVSDDPSFYNTVTYILCAALFIGWLLAARRNGRHRVWLSLAVLVPLSLLPVYHRAYDAKLLLLTIPACCAIWIQRSPRRWFILLTTSAAITLTGDIPGTLITMLVTGLPRNPSSISGKFLVIILTRPIPLILLAMCIFYLWDYSRRSESDPVSCPG